MSLAVVGASSAIAQVIAKEFALDGHKLLLISRDCDRLKKSNMLEEFDRDRIQYCELDIAIRSSITRIAEKVIASFDADPYVLFASGSLGNSIAARKNQEDLFEVVDVNFRNMISVAMLIAEDLRRQRRGCLVFLSSVAGDRAYGARFVYAASKAGLTIFCQGLRKELFASGVHVLTVKLGYVDTPMFRSGIQPPDRHIPRVLLGQPAAVGKKIAYAAKKRKNVVYINSIWRYIMLLANLIPELIFKRLR
jgi:hypothetical protein